MGIKNFNKINENKSEKLVKVVNWYEWIDFFDSFFHEIKCNILFALKDELGMVKGRWEIEINIHKDYINNIDFVSKKVFEILLENNTAEIWDTVICKIKDKQIIN